MVDQKNNKVPDSVGTFSFNLTRGDSKKILNEKLQGRKTPKAYAAARRIAAKKQRVKIPRHLVRQVWRTTGGWREVGVNYVKWGWEYTPDTNWVAITFGGDLKLIMQTDGSPYCCVWYKGIKVFSFSHYGWNDIVRAREARDALAVPYKP